MADSQLSELLGVGIAAVLAIFLWGDSSSVRALLAATAGVIALVYVGRQWRTPLQTKSARRRTKYAKKEDFPAKIQQLFTAAFVDIKASIIVWRGGLSRQFAALTRIQILTRCLGACIISCTIQALNFPGYPWNCLLLGAACSWCLRVAASSPQDGRPAPPFPGFRKCNLRRDDCVYQEKFWADLAGVHDKIEQEEVTCSVQEMYKMMAGMRAEEILLREDAAKEDAPELSETDQDQDDDAAKLGDAFEMMRDMGGFVVKNGSDGRAEAEADDNLSKFSSKPLSLKAREYVPRWARAECDEGCGACHQSSSTPPAAEFDSEVAGTRRPWRAPTISNSVHIAKSIETPMAKQQAPLHPGPASKLRPWKRAVGKPLAATDEDPPDEDEEDLCTAIRSSSQTSKQSTASCETTESGDSMSTRNSDVTISEDSAEEEVAEDTSDREHSSCCGPAEDLPEITIFTVSELLAWRSAVSIDKVNAHELPGMLTALKELPAEPVCEVQERVEAPTQADEMKLQISKNSWAAKRREARSRQADCPDARTDEEIIRAMKSILNKLTIEKFAQLYQQMISCGIRSAKHLEQLIQEVFQKATTQHHFIDMYADLCAQLHTHFAKNPISDDPNVNFKRILLNVCQTSFEDNMQPPADLTALSLEERTEAELNYKMRMIGNIRFVGALLVRKMLASKVMLKIASELLQEATPEAHETLAALLTAVGAEFDTPNFAHHVALSAMFCQVEGLAKQRCTPPRVRCLLKDVLDLRASGWLDRKPKKMDKPTTLEEVHQKAAIEDSSSTACPSRASFGQWSPVHQKSTVGASLSFGSVSVARRVEWNTPEKRWGPHGEPAMECKPKQDRVYRDACHAKLYRTFAELFLTFDTEDAIYRIADIGIPSSHQANKLCEMLAIVCREGNPEKRKVGFRVIATLFLGGHWKPSALADGLNSFVRGTCTELKFAVPVLPWILREELRPALAPTVQAGLLNATQLDGLVLSRV